MYWIENFVQLMLMTPDLHCADFRSEETLYTSSIFGHALLQIVQNLLVQHFDDAVITFIRQEKYRNDTK